MTINAKKWLLLVFVMLSAPGFAAVPGTVQWEYQTGLFHEIINSPAIGSDGTIYFGTTDTATNNSGVYAVTSSGSLKWFSPTGKIDRSSPTIGSDGTVYIGSIDKKLYAIDVNGILKWTFNTVSAIYSSPAIGHDGTIYIVSGKNMYAINADGSQKWLHTSTSSFGYSSPAIGGDDTIYVGAWDQNKFYAINPDGSLQWTFLTNAVVNSSASIGNEGVIYFGTAGGAVYAVDADGLQRWMVSVGGEVSSTPVIGPDGSVYFGSFDKKLYAFDANGNSKWVFTSSERIASSPAIGADGTIYFNNYGSKLYALDANGIKRWEFTGPYSEYPRSSPTIGEDGTVYYGSGSMGTLYAMNSDSGSLADSPWPKFRNGLGNTAAAKPANYYKFYGRVANVSHVKKTYDYGAGNSFVNPVVIAGAASFVGGNGGVVEVSNVTKTNFDIRFAEWEYLDGAHAFEDIPVMVIEAGHRIMPDGSIWEAGVVSQVDSTSNSVIAQHVTFDKPFTQVPYVFATSQTHDDSSPFTVRVRNVTTTGFDIHIQEEEFNKNTGHAFENIGYLAIQGNSVSSALPWVDHWGQVDGTTEDWSGAFNYYVGSEGINDVWETLDFFGNSYEFKLHEETSADTETAHVIETIKIFWIHTATEDLILNQDVSYAGGDVFSIRRR